MKLRLIAVGKLKDPGLRALCDDYQRRLRRYATLTETEVKDDSGVLKQLKSDSFVVALEVEGRALSSTQFAQRLDAFLTLQKRELVFLIGGAEGLSSALKQRTDFALSLSNMTLPHRLARLILCEQLYRAFSILKNEPYARED